MGNRARSSKLVKQIAWSNCASLHLFTSSQSLVFESISQPPPPPPAHNGPIESLHLSYITCPKPNLFLYPLFFFPFPLYFFCPGHPHMSSHTISIKGKLSQSWQSACFLCVCVWRQTVRGKVSEEPVGRHRRGARGIKY